MPQCTYTRTSTAKTPGPHPLLGSGEGGCSLEQALGRKRSQGEYLGDDSKILLSPLVSSGLPQCCRLRSCLPFTPLSILLVPCYLTHLYTQ